jgi:hypothetical protein
MEGLKILLDYGVNDHDGETVFPSRILAIAAAFPNSQASETVVPFECNRLMRSLIAQCSPHAPPIPLQVALLTLFAAAMNRSVR